VGDAGSERPRAPKDAIRLGIFGGTFDPPHNGHLAVATAVRHALALDEVWLVVAHRPWQKADRPVTPAMDRLAMVRAAVEGIAGVRASGVEIERGGDSYTIDTLRQLRAENPDRSIFVIVGADAAAGLDSWKQADELRQAATFVVVDRPGVVDGTPPPGWTYERVTAPYLDIASTDLRRRARAGQPLEGLVPPGVLAVIRSRGLYGGPPT
jgi:nicotinate-nucleotide adenylyltransferase